MAGGREHVVSVRFTAEELATLQRYAERHGDASPSDAIRRAIGYAELLTDPEMAAWKSCPSSCATSDWALTNAALRVGTCRALAHR